MSPDPSPPPPAAGSAETAPRPPMWRRVRENAEAVIIAIILALIIRHYSLEAFEIPTGSMAPGLHGVHVEATCPNCGTTDEIGLLVDSQTNEPRHSYVDGWMYEGPCPECELPLHAGVRQPQAQVRCPRCEQFRAGEPSLYRRTRAYAHEGVRCHACTFEYELCFEPGDVRSGHKILVNKFAYQVDPPERWQVIVFKFNRQRNYIKRLIGLPGETIAVIDGDIHIGAPGRPLAIEPKPIAVQEELWQLVHDSGLPDRGLADGPAWEESGGFEATETGGLEYNALDGSASLVYRRPVRSSCSYNGTRIGHVVETVRDLRALVDLRLGGRDPEAAPVVWVDIRNGDVVYRLSLPVGAGAEADAAVLRIPAALATGERPLPQTMAGEGRPEGWSVLAPLPAGARLDTNRRHAIDFSVVDRQVRAVLDGVVLIDRPLDPRDLDAGTMTGGDPSSGVALRTRRTGGIVERIRLYRDIHYTRDGVQYRYAVREPYRIPADGYFAMGDNSPSSLDSRAWGALHRQNLLGRAFVIFWPALPRDFDWGFIR